jgi:hypothetical protein
MQKLINWIKAHKWKVFFIVIALYLGINFLNVFFGVNVSQLSIPSTSKYGSVSSYGSGGGNFGMMVPSNGIADTVTSALPSYENNATYNTTTTAVTTARMVVQNSNLSLVVKDVKKSGEEVINYANSLGGFLVTSSYSRPNESPTASITIRVPSENFKEAVNYLESLALNVTNENLTGTDITDQYTDIETRIAALEKTKQQFESIMKDTSNIDQILRIQREIVNLQTQIDSYKGQQISIEKEAKMSKITVYLSSDEFSLPYSPDNKFRPGVTFKLAVRSLMGTLSSLANLLIWLMVYAAIWLPILLVILFFRFKKQTAKNNLN